MNTLLFDAAYRFLGTFAFEQGALVQSILSHEGERMIGLMIERWHQEGIPLPWFEERLVPGERLAMMGSKMISPKHEKAAKAFEEWAVGHGLIPLALPERLQSHWQRLQALPLEPEERFISLQAIRSAPYRWIQAWDQALDQVAAGQSSRR